MKISIKFFFFLCFLNINLFVFSQKINRLDTLEVNCIGQKEGLLQLNVMDVDRDSLGYLWLSTQDGLHRYNGNKFKVYLTNPLDSLSIPDDQLRDVYVSKDTLFAVSNSEGAIGFKLSEDSFFRINKKTKGHERGYKVLKLNRNYLLFSMSNYFLLFNRKTKKVEKIDLPKLNVDNHVTSLIHHLKDDFVLATSASGLIRFNLESKTCLSFTQLDNSSHNVIYRKNNFFIVGTNKNLFLVDDSFEIQKQLKKNTIVNCIYEMDNSKFLIGTKQGVLYYDFINQNVKEIVLKDFSKNIYSPLSIYSITGDKKNNIWFGTRGEGLLHYNFFKKKFETIYLTLPNSKADNKVSSYQFLPVKDSTLLIGSTYGVLKYHHKTKKIKHYKETDDVLIYTLCEDSMGDIWAGGFLSSLLKYNKNLDKFDVVKPKNISLLGKDIIQITEVNKSKLLISTWASGMYIYDTSTDYIEEFLVGGKRLNRVRVSFVDSQENLWIGSAEGLFCVKKHGVVQQFTTETKELRISGNRVFSIKEDSFHNLWIGTNVGLTKIDLNSLESEVFYKQEGLPNDFIYSVLIDDSNNIWVSTNMGISMLDFKTKKFTNYTESDGLQNNEFNGKSSFNDNHGNFYFGGIVGVNVFNPNNLVSNPFMPETHIESIELFNSPIKRNELFKEKLEFKSHENVITIHYGALNYLNQEKVNYSYILEGFDKDWRKPTKETSTTYTNLNPGEYTFKVKATNDVGVWSIKGDVMKFEIIPPWYKENWFKIVSVFILFSVLGLFYYLKTKSLERRAIELEKVVAYRTGEILEQKEALELAYFKAEAQKNNINFLMRELKHRVKNNLQIISSLLNIQAYNLQDGRAVDALKVAKNRILTISHLEDKIESDKETVELKNFTEELCNSVLSVLSDDNKFKFKVLYDLETIELKGFNTVLYGLILNELITNVVKYAFNSDSVDNKLEIILYRNNENLIVKVKDNGVGYNETMVSNDSLGLDLVKDMVSQLGGELHVKIKEGVLNIISVRLKEYEVC